MKIIKILGVVVGVHAFAFLIFFVNPGCSSADKAAAAPPPQAPQPAAVASDPPPAPPPDAGTAAPLVPANGPIYYSPTRPDTTAAQALEAAPAPVENVTPAATYTVKPGDSLSRIAHRNHITVSELMKANHLHGSSVLHIGQRLLIPGKESTAASAAESAGVPAGANAVSSAPAKVSGSAGKYVVKPGDKLSAIARHYGLTTGDLAEANNITDPARIRPGQELIIPAGGHPHARKSRTSRASAAPAQETVSAPAPNATPSLVPVEPAPGADTAAPSAAQVPIIRIQGPDDASAPSSDTSAPSK